MGITFIAILWGIISTLVFLQYAHAMEELSTSQSIVIIIVFLFGGPVFALSNILTMIIDSILPEGWDNDEN